MSSNIIKDLFIILVITFFSCILFLFIFGTNVVNASEYSDIKLFEKKENKFELLIGQWSKHEVKGEYNEVHSLIGFEYNDFGYINFKNSYGKQSHAIAYSPEYYTNNYLELGVSYGIVYGYEQVKLFPMVMPKMTLKYKDFPIKLDFNYVPTVVMTAGFRVTF